MKKEEAATVPAPVVEGPSNNRRHIPEVLVEKILLNLPVKSIFRFSIVSKSWRSMIFAPEFSKSYRGREMVVLRSYRGSEDKAWVCPVSSLTTSDYPMDSAALTPFTASIPANSCLHASCGQLWFVESQMSLILRNPSTHAYRTLPAPLPPPRIMFPTGPYAYGLGFDSAADDYKVLKIRPEFLSTETEVYSLKTNSWKKINSEPPLPTKKFMSSKGLFANGLLYWLVKLGLFEKVKRILAFDLHREEYRQLELPNRPVEEPKSERPGIAVFGGKLRVYMNYKCKTRFAVWVLEDYESKLWKKELNISYEHMEPLCDHYLKPFYFYDKFGMLVKAVTSSDDMGSIYVSEDGGSTLIAKNCGMDEWQMFDTYVEGFDSPGHEKHEKPWPQRRVESSSALEITEPLNGRVVLRGVLRDVVYEN